MGDELVGICVNNSYNDIVYQGIIDNQTTTIEPITHINGNVFEGSFVSCVDVRGDNKGLQLGCNTFDYAGAGFYPDNYFYFANAGAVPLWMDEQGSCLSQNNQFFANEMSGNTNFDRVIVEGITSQDVVFNHGPTVFPSTYDGNVIANDCQTWLLDNECEQIAPLTGGGDDEISEGNNDDIFILNEDLLTIINFITNQDLIGLRQFLTNKGEHWSDKLLIINLVAYKDSLTAEQRLAQFEAITQEDAEFKMLMTAINRGEIQTSGAGKAALSKINQIASDKQSKYKTMAESVLANKGLSFRRNAPERNKKTIFDNSISLNTLYCYPNPANDYITLSWDDFDMQRLDEFGSVNILDISGQLMMQKDKDEFNTFTEGITIDISELKSGIYFVQLEGKSSSAKLIVNN